MTKQQTLSIIAAIVAGTALSSCVTTWNTSKRLADSGITYKGADTTRPVGNIVYKAPDGQFYMQAPEVTYQVNTPVVTTRWYMQQTAVDTDKRSVINITPTGNTVCVRVEGLEKDNTFIPQFLCGGKPQLVGTLPEGSVAIPFSDKEVRLSPSYLGQFGTELAPAGAGKVLGSIPLKYVVDPLLSIATNAVVYAAAVPAGVVVGGPSLLLGSRQNQKVVSEIYQFQKPSAPAASAAPASPAIPEPEAN